MSLQSEQSRSASPLSSAESKTSSFSTSGLQVMKEPNFGPEPNLAKDVKLAELFSENVAAKILRVAASHLGQDNKLTTYPEFIPATGPTAGKYTSTHAEFWTCGFFPGSLYTLLERCMKYPKHLSSSGCDRMAFQSQLLELCRTWSEPLHRMATRTDTHDLGFIIQPALRMDWELTGNIRSLHSVIVAAQHLASRYDDRLGAIRSWDRLINKKESITDREENFLVIIDSMCRHHTSDQKMIDMATSHAHFVLRSIVRDDFSTFHVVNVDPRTGNIKRQRTHQGYSDNSRWSRGQAWAILGFTQTYVWTKDTIFLNAAIELANYFLRRVTNSGLAHPFVPLWDFDAPLDSPPLRDTSAGMIAANGLLLLHQVSDNNSPYMAAALRIAKDTIDLSLSPHTASISIKDDGQFTVESGTWDGILMNATANNNENAVRRYSNHGLVYADYYFLEFGNKLMRMGLV